MHPAARKRDVFHRSEGGAYATSDGTARAGSDYTETSGGLSFAALETSKTVSVPVLDDDIDEGSETLTLSDPSPSQYMRIAEGTATGSFEIGVRHDGGDAETGCGADIGAGLAWTASPDPKGCRFWHAAAGTVDTAREGRSCGRAKCGGTPRAGRRETRTVFWD